MPATAAVEGSDTTWGFVGACVGSRAVPMQACGCGGTAATGNGARVGCDCAGAPAVGVGAAMGTLTGSAAPADGATATTPIVAGDCAASAPPVVVASPVGMRCRAAASSRSRWKRSSVSRSQSPHKARCGGAVVAPSTPPEVRWAAGMPAADAGTGSAAAAGAAVAQRGGCAGAGCTRRQPDASLPRTRASVSLSTAWRPARPSAVGMAASAARSSGCSRCSRDSASRGSDARSSASKEPIYEFGWDRSQS
eukprot:366558-Chlamydomonas_euryale.AAC.25